MTDTTFRSVAAGRGAAWLSEAFGLFKMAPGLWIGLVVLMFLGLALVSVVPILGSLAINLLSTVLVGGMLMGARGQSEGKPLQLETLWAGFREPHMKPLLLLGLAYIGLGLLLAVIAALLLFLVLGAAGLSGDLEKINFGFTAFVALILFLVAVAALVLATWMAPALIVFRRVGVVDALKLSFGAGMANMGALTVYGLLAMLIGLVAMIPFGLGLLVAMPVFLISSWCAYRDLFGEPAREPVIA